MASLMMVMAVAAHAQCAFHNDAFKSGEFLTYNLYYNWQFVWVKAGNASMSTVQSRYNGHPAYRASLTTRGNNRVDQMFVLRDTLLCYSSLDMEPLYFRKGAREGKRYGVDEVFYSYHDGKVKIKADNGVKYRCLKLSYLEKEDGKYKRIVDFYVSDDKNHIPVRLDMFLKFGAAKAFLVSMKGLRNPVTSAVR